MSDLLSPEIETVAREPSRAWYNWWRTIAPIGFPIGTEFRMGPHASKDIANTRALAELNALFSRVGLTNDTVEYLDALPDGERP